MLKRCGSALQDHLDHPQRSQQWAEEAEASVRTEFTVDAMVDALEARMPSCWLEAVVLLLAKPLGWLRRMFVPVDRADVSDGVA